MKAERLPSFWREDRHKFDSFIRTKHEQATGMNDSKKSPKSPENADTLFGDINQLTASLHNLDERGLILALAAFAEDALGTLLMAFMLPTDATRQLLEGFNAPLGTFSSRIKAASALGLVTKEQFEDLEHLRKIRNDFSHTWKPISFADQSIAHHIRAINFSNGADEFPETPFEKVRTALSFLLVELHVAAKQIEWKDRRVRVIGSRLGTGVPGDFEQQIETARTTLVTLEKELLAAVGEKRAFLVLVMKRWVERLDYIEGIAPAERREEVIALNKELQRKISETT